MIIAGGIKRIEDWYCKAGPKDRDAQWEDDHSAKEFAKLWFNKKQIKIPHGIDRQISMIFPNFRYQFLIPEHITALDRYPGGQRNHDLLIYGKIENKEDGIICIEAKATESLDSTIEDKYASVTNNASSNLPKRIDQMLAYFNVVKEAVKNLRYQLFTGLYGTICEAKNQQVSKCIFMTVQLITNKTKEKEIEETKKDIELFLSVLGGIDTTGFETNEYFRQIKVKDDNLNVFLSYLQIDVRYTRT